MRPWIRVVKLPFTHRINYQILNIEDKNDKRKAKVNWQSCWYQDQWKVSTEWLERIPCHPLVPDATDVEFSAWANMGNCHLLKSLQENRFRLRSLEIEKQILTHDVNRNLNRAGNFSFWYMKAASHNIMQSLECWTLRPYSSSISDFQHRVEDQRRGAFELVVFVYDAEGGHKLSCDS